MQRIKTNIIEISKLYKKPCDAWLELFLNKKLDAHVAFKKHGEQYKWLYNFSPYDLIGWEIDNGVFDWERHSIYNAWFVPQYFDKEKYNWTKYSGTVILYSPQLFDASKFNWKEKSGLVAKFLPQFLNEKTKDLYNWDKDYKSVKLYCPEKLQFAPDWVKKKYLK